MIQEWWGLVDHIRDVCDRLARAGFVALAPDLYRGETASDPDTAGRLMMGLEIPRAARDLDAAVQVLQSQPEVDGAKVGAIGFCMGGQLALFAATRNARIGAVVDCYGVHPNVTLDLAGLEAAVLGIFAERDTFVPPKVAGELEAALRAAGKRVALHDLPGRRPRLPERHAPGRLRRRRRGARVGRDRRVPARGAGMSAVGARSRAGRPAAAARRRRVAREAAAAARAARTCRTRSRRASRGCRRRSTSTASIPFGYDPSYVSQMLLPIALIYRYWLRVETSGIERVPPGRVLLIANHGGNTFAWDGAMLTMAMLMDAEPPRAVRGMAEYYLPTLPFFGTMMHRMGSVVGTPSNCAQLLDRGEAIMVFPEGERGFVKPYTERYQLQRFGLGFMRLALETDTPIVPVGIVGSEEQSPGLLRSAWLGKLVGAPVAPITLTFPWLGACRFPAAAGEVPAALRRAAALRRRSQRGRRGDPEEGRRRQGRDPRGHRGRPGGAPGLVRLNRGAVGAPRAASARATSQG